MDEQRFTEVYLPKYRDVIEALARKVARRDHELYEDLVQTGLIILWQLDPAKATSNEDAWIRTALYNNMISARRREKRQHTESLETMVERGAQIIENEVGEAQVIVPRGSRRQRPSDYDGGDSDE